MTFKVPVVKSCPVSKASKGVIHFTPELIAQIAGAARDKIEWMALLNGTRSEDGFDVYVERFTIPQQYRGSAHADLPEQDLEADVVGVMHLHPWYRQANFSSIDDNDLNPRFPCSIVVSPAHNVLGFTYEACGKVTLPCGALGAEVQFEVNVVGVDRFAATAVHATHSGEVESLGDCKRYDENLVDQWTVTESAKCGLTTPEMERTMAFGTAGGEEFLALVKEQTLEKPVQYGKGSGKYSGKHNARQDNVIDLSGERWEGFREGADASAADVDWFGLGAGRYLDHSGCDGCNVQGARLRFHTDYGEWFCKDCYNEAEDRIEYWRDVETDTALTTV